MSPMESQIWGVPAIPWPSNECSTTTLGTKIPKGAEEGFLKEEGYVAWPRVEVCWGRGSRMWIEKTRWGGIWGWSLKMVGFPLTGPWVFSYLKHDQHLGWRLGSTTNLRKQPYMMLFFCWGGGNYRWEWMDDDDDDDDDCWCRITSW